MKPPELDSPLAHLPGLRAALDQLAALKSAVDRQCDSWVGRTIMVDVNGEWQLADVLCVKSPDVLIRYESGITGQYSIVQVLDWNPGLMALVRSPNRLAA